MSALQDEHPTNISDPRTQDVWLSPFPTQREEGHG